MNVIILSRLFQAAWPKPKVPTNNVHNSSPLWRPELSKPGKKSTLFSSKTVPQLYCRNCRKYKNFGHARDPPKSKWVSVYIFVFTFAPLLLFVNYKLIFYHFKKDWFDYFDKNDTYYEEEIPRFPISPGH